MQYRNGTTKEKDTQLGSAQTATSLFGKRRANMKCPVCGEEMKELEDKHICPKCGWIESTIEL